jgi:hypothetical protein
LGKCLPADEYRKLIQVFDHFLSGIPAALPSKGSRKIVVGLSHISSLFGNSVKRKPEISVGVPRSCGGKRAFFTHAAAIRNNIYVVSPASRHRHQCATLMPFIKAIGIAYLRNYLWSGSIWGKIWKQIQGRQLLMPHGGNVSLT